MNFHEFKALPRSGTGLRLEDQDPRLVAAVQDQAVMLYYSPTLRSYMVPDLEPNRIPRRNSIPPKRKMPWGLSIWFCPFTGHLLPGKVLEAWNHRAKKVRPNPVEYMFKDGRHSIPGLRGEQWWVREEVGPTFSGMTQREMYEEIKREPIVDYRGGFFSGIPPGYIRPVEAPDHYCYSMSECFCKIAPQYHYVARTREYGFRIADLDRRLDFQPIKILAAPYCPWCGEKLPRSVRPEWEEQMRARGVDPESEEIPADLNTDTWWREAGL